MNKLRSLDQNKSFPIFMMKFGWIALNALKKLLLEITEIRNQPACSVWDVDIIKRLSWSIRLPPITFSEQIFGYYILLKMRYSLLITEHIQNTCKIIFQQVFGNIKTEPTSPFQKSFRNSITKLKIVMHYSVSSESLKQNKQKNLPTGKVLYYSLLIAHYLL